MLRWSMVSSDMSMNSPTLIRSMSFCGSEGSPVLKDGVEVGVIRSGLQGIELVGS